MQAGSTQLYVVPSLDRGWTVRDSLDGPSLRYCTTRRGAMFYATGVLEQRGGVVTVFDPDGEVEESRTLAAAGPRPWWYVRRSWSTWVLAVLLPVQSLSHLLSGPVHGMGWGWWVFLVFGTGYLASLVASELRSRRNGHARQPSV